MTIKKITDRHDAMIYALIMECKTQKEVCEEFDITPSRLSILRQSPLWVIKEEVVRKERATLKRERLEKATEKLEELRLPAVEALRECVVSDNEGIKLRTAQDILNRTGISTTINIEGKGIAPVISLYIPEAYKENAGK